MSENTQAISHNVQIPEGYEDANKDPDIWDPADGPIAIVPRWAKVMDSTINASKASILVGGTLTQDCLLRRKEDEERIVVKAQAGEEAQVWLSAGLLRLVRFCDVPVIIVPTGKEIKTEGSKQPMKVFEILAPKGHKKKLVPLEADNRYKSVDDEIVWDRVKEVLKKTGKTMEQLDDDDIPF